MTDVHPGFGPVEGLCLTPAPFVPEIRLHLAVNPITYRRRAEEVYRVEAAPIWPPFWATAWSGGQALSRYLLDHPEVVEGQRVLDVACGSGIVAIAAAMAGAAEAVANDVDSRALAAVAANARVNRVP